MEPADGRLPPPVADRRGLLRVHADEQDVGEGDGAAAAGGQGEAGGAAAGAGRHNSIEKAWPKFGQRDKQHLEIALCFVGFQMYPNL